MKSPFPPLPLLVCLVCLVCFGASSCTSRQGVRVSHFHLREETFSSKQIDPIRAETNYHLTGHLKASQRRARKGHYYTCRWTLSTLKEGPTAPALTALFEYRQPATGRQNQQLSKQLAPTRKGKTTFEVTGAPYLKKGRVVAWKITLLQDGQILGTQQSFLWD